MKHRLAASLAFFILLPQGQPGAQSATFSLAPAGCAMAHCDARMSDNGHSVGPASGVLAAIDSGTSGKNAGIGSGLGCASNTSIVACTFGVDPAMHSDLIVYDALGHRLWEDHGLLGATAWNETCDSLRRQHLTAAWSEHGRFIDQQVCLEGRAALHEHIARCQASHPGARFVLTSLAAQHHRVMHFTWSLLDAHGRHVIAGCDFGEVDNDGRIQHLVAFFNAPSARSLAPRSPIQVPPYSGCRAARRGGDDSPRIAARRRAV